jgi:hypothetical protein
LEIVVVQVAITTGLAQSNCNTSSDVELPAHLPECSGARVPAGKRRGLLTVSRDIQRRQASPAMTWSERRVGSGIEHMF